MTTSGSGDSVTVVPVELSAAVAACAAHAAAASAHSDAAQAAQGVVAAKLAEIQQHAITARANARAATNAAASIGDDAEAAVTAASTATSAATTAATAATTATTAASTATAEATAAAADRVLAQAAAAAAAASAAAAALFDPSSYYAKSEFKSDGTNSAPVKYTSTGALIATSLSINVSGAVSSWLNWQNGGVTRWSMRSDASGNCQFTAYDAAGGLAGGVWSISNATQIITFTQSPTGPTPASGDSSNKFATTGFVAGEVTKSVPAGTAAYFAGSTAPTGWLKANGAVVSRSTYATLFAAIGTTYGVGDGSTTFALPDLRGEFVRGLDDGRGVDSGRALGTAQADAFQGHKHSAASLSTGAGSGENPFYATVLGTSGVPVSDGANGTPRTAAETRPRNIALLACIKY